ncbi:MAG: WD40/YVTN/BNR-like repeat-containing protein [Magnetospiraceae bacterium]
MSDLLHVSTRKGLFTVARGAAGWRIGSIDFLGDNVSLTHLDPRDGRLYAALDHGHFGVKMHRRTGDRWEELPAPAYPAPPEGETEKDMWGRTLEWKTARIWALQSGGADQPGLLWCGTLPGGLFTSADHGESWEMVRALWDHPKRKYWMGGGADLPGIHSILIDPRDANTVCVGVSTGGLWITRDGGATWHEHGQGMRAEYVPPELTHEPVAQDVHCAVQCPAAPERVWVQHHNGIFISDDGGAHFREITDVQPSTFGFPVAVHPTDPETAWFVPAQKDEFRYAKDGKVVVSRTRDGGKTFETLTEGLPQENAFDLVYRHALALDETGDRLAFGSTTGNLWVSEDQGDHWSCISNTLPPIHAVRFG